MKFPFSLSSLRVRAIVVLLLALVPALTVSLWTVAEWRRHETAEVRVTALRFARHAAAIHGRLIDGSRHMLVALAESEVTAQGDPSAVGMYLLGTLRSHPDILDLGMARVDGVVLLSARATDQPVDVSGRNFFRAAVRSRSFAVGDYDIDRATGVGTVMVGYPVLDQHQDIRHVLFAVVGLSWLRELAMEAPLPEATVLAVLDQDGRVVVQQPGPTRHVAPALRTPVLPTVLEANTEGTGEEASADGFQRLFGFAPLQNHSGSGMTHVAVGVPLAAATAAADRLFMLTLAGFGLAVVLAVGVAWLGTDMFVLRRVNAVVGTTERIRGGDLDARTGLPHGRAELDRLAAAVDEMADALERRVEERTAELTRANDALQAEIADRARVEQSLRKLSRAIEQAGDSVFVTNRQGTIEYVNPSFEKLTGFTWDEAVGQTPKLFNSGKHDRAFFERMWNTLLAGEVFRTVFTNKTKDGRLYVEDQTISPLRDAAGQITHFVSTGRDITRRRRTEEALRRLNDRFESEVTRIATLLHDEAGQCLTHAHITLAEVGAASAPDVRDRLQEVRSSLDRVEEQMRGLSHELHPRILDDLGLVEAVKFLAEGVRRRSGLDVAVEASLGPGHGRVVETALYRLAQEGLTNMTRHAHATHGTIVLRESARQISCSISDNGLGFDVKGLETRPGARGLGLAAVRDRLEAVGGALTIVSGPGAGTEISASIPLET
jgi:PAS domain S-box-containing protein